MIDDAQLLSEFRTTGSERAFGELVSRYLDLVFSAALRLVGRDHQLAEDVCQAVFTALAQKGRGLPKNVVLGGWLYRHTCFVASQTVRTERRRRLREEEAAFMNAPDHSVEPDWEKLAPELEEAMQGLDSRDRDAIILRFFQGHNLRAVGSALGTSEDAARMRVVRALDKLKYYFDQKGIRVSAPVLAALLAGHAVSAAPAGMAAAIASSTFAAASLSGVSSVGGFLKLTIMNKIITGILGTASVAGLTASVVIHHQLSVTREENSQLRAAIQEVQTLRAENDRLKASSVSSNELARLRKQESELLRLRGQNGLTQRLPKNGKPLTATQLGSSAGDSGLGVSESIQSTKVKTTLGVTDTLVTGGMETHPGKRTYVLVAPHVENDQVTLQATLVEAPDAVWAGLGIDSADSTEGHHDQETILNEQSAQSLLTALENNPEAQILSRPRISSGDGVEGSMTIETGESTQTLTTSYHMAADHKSLDLNLVAQQRRREVAADSATIKPNGR